MKKYAFLIVLSLFLGILAGCGPEAKFIDPSNDYLENNPELIKEIPVEDKQTEEPETEGYLKEPEEMVNPKPEPEPVEEKTVDPFCGDGTCDADETCDRCVKDCGCNLPRVCYHGECVEPRCDRDSDCVDADACTIDKCYFPAHPNAYCGHEDYKRCKDGDECCPRDCNSDNDDDCEPDCGNHVCESSEDEDSCPKDCGSECGNRECEEGENDDICPEDCTPQTECGNQICEAGEDPNNCPYDCYM